MVSLVFFSVYVMRAPADTGDGQISNIFLYSFPPYFLRQSISLNFRLVISYCSLFSKLPEYTRLCPLVLEHPGHVIMPVFGSTGGLNSVQMLFS